MPDIDQNFWEDYQHLKKEVINLRQSESRLMEIRSRHQASMKSSTNLLAVIDSEGRFSEISKRGLELLKLAERDILGKSAKEAFKDAKAAVLGDHARDAVLHGKTVKFTWRVARIGATPLVFRVRIEPIVDNTNRITGAFIDASDISEILDLQERFSDLQSQVNDMKAQLDKLLGN
ncbi:PAS domain-containing protein [bacterium]|nr:PAS domain-containing protein [bacterium]